LPSEGAFCDLGIQYIGTTVRHLFAIPTKAGSRDLARLFIEDDPAITAGWGNGGLSDKVNHTRSMARWPPGSGAARRKICLLIFKLTHYPHLRSFAFICGSNFLL
jgi:hypothetical protein